MAAIMALGLITSPPSVVIALDVVSRRLELAKKYGVTTTINCLDVDDLKQALLDATDGRGIDGSIDTTGRPEVVQALLKASAHKGTVVQVGVGSVSGHSYWQAHLHMLMVHPIADSRGINWLV